MSYISQKLCKLYNLRTNMARASSCLTYLLTIIGANWAITHFGIVPIGFGLMAPAGIYFVSMALVLRDYIQWSLGKKVSLSIMGIGILVSYIVSSSIIAIASASAFGISEFMDFLFFTWISPRWARAVFVGGTAGAAVDSLVFLSIAFGSLEYWPGQFVGKMYGIVIATTIIKWRRAKRPTA